MSALVNDKIIKVEFHSSLITPNYLTAFFFLLYKNRFHFSSATPCLSISERAIVKNKSDNRLM